MNFVYTLSIVIIDGYRNNINNATVPTLVNMQNELKDVEGFIIPLKTSQYPIERQQYVKEATEWVELAQKLNKPIYGYRIVPSDPANPRPAVQQGVGFLKTHNLLYKNTTVFIDARKMLFEMDCVKNNRYVVEMYDELQMHLNGPQRIGVMTKKQIWTDNMCNMKWDHVRLWYVNHNDKQTMKEFTSFGQWRTPFVKQYVQKAFKGEEAGVADDYVYTLNWMEKPEEGKK